MHPGKPLPSSSRTPLHIDLVFPFSHPLFPRWGACADLPADWIRARFIRYFSRVAAKVDGNCVRGNTSKNAEAITTFHPSDEGSSQSTLRTIFSSLRSLYPTLCARRTLYLFLGTCSVPSVARTKVTLTLQRENANSRSIGKAGLRAVFVCARHVDV